MQGWDGETPFRPPPLRNRQADLSAVDSSPLPLPPGPAQGSSHCGHRKDGEGNGECGVPSLSWRVWTEVTSVEWRVGKGEQRDCIDLRMWSVENMVS